MPVIIPVEDIGYTIKCPDNNRHYSTPAGLIDIENWNYHNAVDSPVSVFDPASLFSC